MSGKKLSLVPVLLGIGVFAGAFALFKKPTRDRLTGKSGQSWDVELVSVTGDTKTYDVYAPAGSVGNASPLFVVRYQQTGSNMTNRPIVSVNPAAAGPLSQTAQSDFGLKAAA